MALGTRLGYGGGFYDRTLANTDTVPFTSAWRMAFVPWVEAEPHDMALDQESRPRKARHGQRES